MAALTDRRIVKIGLYVDEDRMDQAKLIRGLAMSETVEVQLRLPADVVAAVRGRAQRAVPEEDQLRFPLAIGLFAQRAITLAKAASLASMSRYEFALSLKPIGLGAYEYGETEYKEDLAFVASAKEP
jgi:predicted HTH domain antitoxin